MLYEVITQAVEELLRKNRTDEAGKQLEQLAKAARDPAVVAIKMTVSYNFV